MFVSFLVNHLSGDPDLRREKLGPASSSADLNLAAALLEPPAGRPLVKQDGLDKNQRAMG